MSCMMANGETISIIANFMSRLFNCGYDSFGFSAPESVFLAFGDCRDDSGVYRSSKIYESLRKLNEMAYCERYKSEKYLPDMDIYVNPDVDIWELPVVKDNSYLAQPWHYRLLKCLQFLEYQLLEDAIADDPRTNALQELGICLALFVSTHNEQYNSFSWGSLKEACK